MELKFNPDMNQVFFILWFSKGQKSLYFLEHRKKWLIEWQEKKKNERGLRVIVK